MRGSDGYSEQLFTQIRLEEFVPPTHPLRPIRQWVNEVLASMNERFNAMYEADIKGGRPSIAPEKLLRAMLLQVLYSIRSERQLMEQIHYNLLFRWFVGLSVDDRVWDHSVFSKNRDRLIEHDAVVMFFERTVEMAHKRGLLSGEHFSVDGTLIQAWAGHKSFRRKDDHDAGGPSGNWHGEKRSNQTHQSRTDPQARLYRKSGATGAILCYQGHVLTDNRHGLVVDAKASLANGRAERESAIDMLARVPVRAARATVGADRAYDAGDFVSSCREHGVTPHVAQNLSRRSAIDARTVRHAGYGISQKKRKCIEQCFGWAKQIGPMRQVMVRGLRKVGQVLTLTMAAYNLVRLRALLVPVCP